MTHFSLKDRLDALAVGLQGAAERESKRQRLSPQDVSGTDSLLVGAGVFEESAEMRERHKEMDEQQRISNNEISKNTTRF